MRNYVSLIGCIGTDPQSKEVKNGLKLCKFRLAVRSTKGGQEHTSWFSVASFDRTAQKAEAMSKGDLVCLSGSISIDEYETKEGERRVQVEVTAREIHKLDYSKSRGRNDQW